MIVLGTPGGGGSAIFKVQLATLIGTTGRRGSRGVASVGICRQLETYDGTAGRRRVVAWYGTTVSIDKQQYVRLHMGVKHTQ